MKRKWRVTIYREDDTPYFTTDVKAPATELPYSDVIEELMRQWKSEIGVMLGAPAVPKIYPCRKQPLTPHLGRPCSEVH